MRSYFPRALPRLRAFTAIGGFAILIPCLLHAVIDVDLDQQSDIWELTYTTGALAPNADADQDGFSNTLESVAGTNPFAFTSRPSLALTFTGSAQLQWQPFFGKRYEIQSSIALASPTLWQSDLVSDDGSTATFSPPFDSSVQKFFRLVVSDLDSDGDSLADWEEFQIGFDPYRANTEGFTTTDYNRVASALSATTSVSTSAIDAVMTENWPDAGVVAIRRTGSLAPVTIQYTVSGTASSGSDFTGPASGSITLGLGVEETWLSFTPLTDALTESSETIVVTLQPAAGYIVNSPSSATLTVADSPAGSISEKEAVRFLLQCTFGPTPADIARVQTLGFEGWLDEQIVQPPQLHFPLLQIWRQEIIDAYIAAGLEDEIQNNQLEKSAERMEVWWRRAMQTDASADPLRQRLAHALSQIFVISDEVSMLNNNPRGMGAYHDQLLTNCLGNYRQMLLDVTLNPTMGFYLSHLRNRAKYVAGGQEVYPDENYAREIMQLFSIGIFMLNPDGTLQVDDDGNNILTYSPTDISNLARVFTGLSYSKRFTDFGKSMNWTDNDSSRFLTGNGVWFFPMRGYDKYNGTVYHDLAPKTLINGVTLPDRTSVADSNGTATILDVNAAIDMLVAHPNTGPFISTLLIKRLVTSNPSPAYVARVAAVFVNNGAGVTGDMTAVFKAILLDDEARNPTYLDDPDRGLQREPYLRYVSLVRALHRPPPQDGRYRGFYNVGQDFFQRPYSSPSVFNFYLPDYLPLGPMKDAGLSGPEFQITNGITGITSPNRFYSGLYTRFNASGPNTPELNTVLEPTPWLTDAKDNVDGMIARLDRLLTGGRLSPATLHNIARAVRRLPDPYGISDPPTQDIYATDRLKMAAYLVAISPEGCILK